MKDGTLAAIKVLSADSRQGAREFLTEINVIKDTKHENLVELYGCCVERDHRILVYGYLENNSLAQTLLGKWLYFFFFYFFIFLGLCVFVFINCLVNKICYLSLSTVYLIKIFYFR